MLERANQRGQRRRNGFSAEATDALIAYDWPGNLRELDPVIDVAHAGGASTSSSWKTCRPRSGATWARPTPRRRCPRWSSPWTTCSPRWIAGSSSGLSDVPGRTSLRCRSARNLPPPALPPHQGAEHPRRARASRLRRRRTLSPCLEHGVRRSGLGYSASNWSQGRRVKSPDAIAHQLGPLPAINRLEPIYPLLVPITLGRLRRRSRQRPEPLRLERPRALVGLLDDQGRGPRGLLDQGQPALGARARRRRWRGCRPSCRRGRRP